MSQQYVIVSRKNPGRPDEGAKFYALARSMRTVNVDEICHRISERASYSLGELEGVIGEFLLEVKNVLTEGSIAHVGKLGSFRLGVRTSKPTKTADEFSNAHVGSCKVLFNPSTYLKDLCKTMKYTPYKIAEAPAEEETPAV